MVIQLKKESFLIIKTVYYFLNKVRYQKDKRESMYIKVFRKSRGKLCVTTRMDLCFKRLSLKFMLGFDISYVNVLFIFR